VSSLFRVFVIKFYMGLCVSACLAIASATAGG